MPDLVDWMGDERAPDIDIRFGSLAGHGADWRAFSPAIRIGPNGEVLIGIPNVASYLVEGGDRVIIDPVLPAEAPDIRVFLLGTVLVVLCYNRGLLPLHASAVEADGGAVLMAGRSGLGKSTLAAALVTRGARMAADDICALDFSNGATPVVWPAFPRMKLWADAAERLEIPVASAEQSRGSLRKHHIPVPTEVFGHSPLRPRLLLALERAPAPSPVQWTPLRGLAAMQRREVAHRVLLAEALGHSSLIFRGLTALAQSVPMLAFKRYDDLAALPALADRVLELSGSVH